LRGAARDLCSGSGLTANRKNLLNASELYPAFNWVSRSPRPALCYRPLPAFPASPCGVRVTWLEPRTPHQPEKLQKLSKNDLVVLLLKIESTKRWRVYVVCFQASAASAQGGDRIWCSLEKGFAQRCARRCGIHYETIGMKDVAFFCRGRAPVNIGQKALWARYFAGC
jgi:hypothetical protein